VFAVPSQRRHRDYLRLMTLLVTLLVSLTGCGTTAVGSATLPGHAPSPTADLACVTRHAAST
jgi:hypothetical protein